MNFFGDDQQPPAPSPFMDFLLMHAVRNDPVIQTLLAGAALPAPSGSDWYTPNWFEMQTYEGIPEGSHYNSKHDAWLLPDGSAMPADFNTRPVLNNFGNSFSNAFGKQQGIG
jgi:hypothetical protein